MKSQLSNIDIITAVIQSRGYKLPKKFDQQQMEVIILQSYWHFGPLLFNQISVNIVHFYVYAHPHPFPKNTSYSVLIDIQLFEKGVPCRYCKAGMAKKASQAL